MRLKQMLTKAKPSNVHMAHKQKGRPGGQPSCSKVI